MSLSKSDILKTTTRFCGMAIGGALTLALACSSASKPAHATAHAVAGPVTLIAQIIIAAGSPNGSVVVRTIPNNFRLVIQTVSFFRSNVVSGSIGQLFLQVTLNGAAGYVALPEAVADGAVYPAATLSTTLYCDVETQLILNAYRTGNDSASETENVLITGYYEAYPPAS